MHYVSTPAYVTRTYIVCPNILNVINAWIVSPGTRRTYSCYYPDAWMFKGSTIMLYWYFCSSCIELYSYRDTIKICTALCGKRSAFPPSFLYHMQPKMSAKSTKLEQRNFRTGNFSQHYYQTRSRSINSLMMFFENNRNNSITSEFNTRSFIEKWEKLKQI